MKNQNRHPGLMDSTAPVRAYDRAGAEMPRYRLTAPAYFDRVYDIDEEIETELPPGRHMVPLNDAADRMKEETPEGKDPLRLLNSVPRFKGETTEDTMAALLAAVVAMRAAPPAPEVALQP